MQYTSNDKEGKSEASSDFKRAVKRPEGGRKSSHPTQKAYAIKENLPTNS